VTKEEKTCFDFFRRRTALKLPGVFDSDFWESLIFQASSTEPAVLHAIIALGSAHRSEELNSHGSEYRGLLKDEGKMDRHERFALQQYNKAISHLQKHFSTKDKMSLRIALITCMMFICLEFLRGEYKTGNTHIENGLNLLSQMQDRGDGETDDNVLVVRPQPESVDDYLIEAFACLNMQSALFGLGSRRLYIVAQELKGGPDFQIPQTFSSIYETRQYLDGLLNAVYYLVEQCYLLELTSSPYPLALQDQKSRLQTAILDWLVRYESSLPSLLSTINPRTALGLPLLRIYHTMTTIMISTCLSSAHEKIFDSYTPAFTSVITQAIDIWTLTGHAIPCVSNPNCEISGISFTVDMGFIPPMYYTALKCRVPSLRRQAIKLLLAAPHREGIWDGTLVARIAGQVMEMEEGEFFKDVAIGLDRNAFDMPERQNDQEKLRVPALPESSRFHEVKIVMSEDFKNTGTLVCKRRRHEGNGGWDVQTTEFDFGDGRASC